MMGRLIKFLFILPLVLMVLLLSACSSLNEQLSIEGKGEIVLTLSRGAELSSLDGSAAFTELSDDSGAEAGTAGAENSGAEAVLAETANEPPRTAETVQGMLEGYLVRIQDSEGGEVCYAEYLFGDEDVIAASFEVPAGEQYTVTLLALGTLSPGTQEQKRLLLGAGRNQVLVTSTAEPTPVYVPMLTYRYFANSSGAWFYTDDYTETAYYVPMFYIMGPFLEEIFAIGNDGSNDNGYFSRDFYDYFPGDYYELTKSRLYWTTTPPGDLNGGEDYTIGQRVSKVAALIDAHNSNQRYDSILYLPLIYADEVSLSDEIYIQLELLLNEDWSREGINTHFLIPAFYNNEEPISFIPVS